MSERLEDAVDHTASRERLAQLNKQNRVSDRNCDNEEIGPGSSSLACNLKDLLLG